MPAEVETLYWNCWTRNYSAAADGYIIHAFEETITRTKKRKRTTHTDRTLCGVRWDETGLCRIPDEVEPGCIKCRRILRNRGISLSW